MCLRFLACSELITIAIAIIIIVWVHHHHRNQSHHNHHHWNHSHHPHDAQVRRPMVDWSHSARTSRWSQLRELDLGSHWDWDYMVTFCDGEHILFGSLSNCPQEKILILNWYSGTIGWGMSQTIGTARIAWLSSNGGSVTSSHHDPNHLYHYFRWSKPYCPLSSSLSTSTSSSSWKAWKTDYLSFFIFRVQTSVSSGPGWFWHLPLERLGL